MDEDSKKVGIIFDFNRNWFGGVNYIINLINSFNYLEEKKQPNIIIFYSNENYQFKSEVTYQKVQWCPLNYILSKNSLYLFSILFRKNFLITREMLCCEAIFPANDLPVKSKIKTSLISWIPDFQHKTYPKNFSLLGKLLRELKFRLILSNSNKTILSSKNSNGDFLEYYKNYNTDIKIIPFVSVIEKLDFNEEIFSKLGITKGNFFIVSNQFHIHKNFEVVINAFEKFAKDKLNLKLIITGGKSKNNSEYYSKIKNLASKSTQNYKIIFTGFIPREDVLCLMKNCKCLIQPSFFEGWNTAIEDCKSLGTQIIASNIEVHKEQLGKNGIYFDPTNEKDLIEKMDLIYNSNTKLNVINHIRYSKFSELFLNEITN